MMEPISPELVLVDPELRARIAHLPIGPVYRPRPDPIRAEPVSSAPASSLNRVLATVAAILLFLSLPLLAIAADLVRDEPRLGPPGPAGSGLVDVPAQEHVAADPLDGQVTQLPRRR
jgi:hypothetical protein